ncbi:MAG: glycosyl hydrolase [Acidipropionibacterium sp.]|nr:glycosyl hydrolase [Acidipropionibacterium sp.]
MVTPAIALALALSACSPGGPDQKSQKTQKAPSGTAAPAPSGTSGGDAFLTAAQVNPLVSKIGSRTGADLKPARTAAGLTPPTNRWFSGLVFGPTPNAVFPLPLTFGLDGAGFGFGLPEVTTAPKVIMGGYRPVIQIGLGADSWQLTRYDEMSVTLTARKQGAAIATVTLAQGSPFITVAALGERRLSTNLPFAGTGSNWSVKGGEDTYALTGSDGVSVSGTAVTVPDKGHVTFYPLPSGGDAAALSRLAASPLRSTASSYQESGGTVTTRLAYTTEDGSATAFAALPHQQGDQQRCDLGSYRSVLGTMTLCQGTALSWTSKTYPASAQLDLSGLDQSRRATLRKQVDADVAALKPYPADTYFGGKAMYRDAQLYTIARQIGATASAATLKKRVDSQLRKWADPSGCGSRTSLCFFYDKTNKGMVGLTPSFGSEQFNDHHFHYGYFLYAAGVMAADDRDLMTALRPVMTLLAADIASPRDTGTFPQRRNFDPYASHSWASGTSPFGDGNNQESVSEAVNAWVGLGLWAKGRGGPRAGGGGQLDAGAGDPVLAGLLDELQHRRSALQGLPAHHHAAGVGRQTRLRHLVLAGAGRCPGHCADPDESVVGLPGGRPETDRNQPQGGPRYQGLQPDLWRSAPAVLRTSGAVPARRRRRQGVLPQLDRRLADPQLHPGLSVQPEVLRIRPRDALT